MGIVDFARAFPVLPTLNKDVTRQFYVESLGFEVVNDDEGYLIVRRNEMELHFWLTDNADLPKASSCYIRGGQIKDLHQEYSQKKVPNLSEFKVQPWDMAEFHVLDPHSNLLRFGCIPGE